MNRQFWTDRPTLVTGATGLVGSWLVKQLIEAGADVICLVRDFVPQSEFYRAGLAEKVKSVRGDIRDISSVSRALQEYEVNTVFHLAAQTLVGVANSNPLFTLESNVRGTWNVIEASRNTSSVKSVVIASSDKAYGSQKILPYTEEAPLQGEHPYDVSKSCSDLIAHAYAVTYGLPVAITRCGNFYGGGDLNWSRIVPGTIRSAIRKERPLLRSNGQFIRDYLYVEDGARAYMLLAQALVDRPELRGQAFNFSIERRISVLELTRMILAEMKSDLEPLILNQAQNEIPNQYLSAARAREVLGWEPQYSLEEGLRKTVDWYTAFFGMRMHGD